MAADSTLRNAGIRVLTVGALWGVLLSCGMVSAARSETAAVKAALPATVGVEWHDVKSVEALAPDQKSYSSETKPNQAGLASGTILSADGLIVTVISVDRAISQKAGTHSVVFGDGRKLEARLIVEDHRSGLQLLKVEATDLPFLALASRPVQLGEMVYATYCLDSQERAAAAGIVAATSRNLRELGSDLLQLDMSVAVTSAGEPVVDSDEKLLGVIAYRRVGAASAASFAVPAKAIQALLDAREGDHPKVIQRGQLGLYLNGAETKDGRVIARLSAGSPAAAAGVRDGDELVAVDGTKIMSVRDLLKRTRRFVAGEKIWVDLIRDGRSHTFEITLAPAHSPYSPYVSATNDADSARPALTKASPETIYVLDREGKLQPLQLKETDKSLESIREQYKRAYQAQGEVGRTLSNEPSATVPTIHVERSNLEQKLDELTREMKSLRDKMDKLTDELQQLKKARPVEPPKR